MDIPVDVVTTILVRLPVKSLLRFRCVCKAWRDLIGCHRFIDMHLRQERRGKEREYLVVKRFETKEENTRLSFYQRGDGDDLHQTAPDLKMFPPGTMHITGPCDGICLIGKSLYRDMFWDGMDSQYDWESNPLYLCNPATREFRKIPDRPFGMQRARPRINSGINYNCKRVGVGFGYDSRINDYKVVSIIHFMKDEYVSQGTSCGPLKIEIYTLSFNSWRVADTVFPMADIYDPRLYGLHDLQAGMNIDSDQLDTDEYDDILIDLCGVFLNGCIHWSARAHKVILAFNISDELMRAIVIPRALLAQENYQGNRIFVLVDSLAFVHNSFDSFNVWVMMEYGDEESWMKRFFFKPQVDIDVLAFWGDTVICEVKDGALASCNLQEEEEELAGEFRIHHHIKRYVPGLVHELEPNRNMMGAIVMHKESLVRLR